LVPVISYGNGNPLTELTRPHLRAKPVAAALASVRR
jgi:hypothetical protein